eukprot:1575577-Amphidinium_carterae.1
MVSKSSQVCSSGKKDMGSTDINMKPRRLWHRCTCTDPSSFSTPPHELLQIRPRFATTVFVAETLLVAQDHCWLFSPEGSPLQVHVSRCSCPQRLRQRARSITTIDSQLWDNDPQLAELRALAGERDVLHTRTDNGWTARDRLSCVLSTAMQQTMRNCPPQEATGADHDVTRMEASSPEAEPRGTSPPHHPATSITTERRVGNAGDG